MVLELRVVGTDVIRIGFVTYYDQCKFIGIFSC
jgi:hypothetical protein